MESFAFYLMPMLHFLSEILPRLHLLHEAITNPCILPLDGTLDTNALVFFVATFLLSIVCVNDILLLKDR